MLYKYVVFSGQMYLNCDYLKKLSTGNVEKNVGLCVCKSLSKMLTTCRVESLFRRSIRY